MATKRADRGKGGVLLAGGRLPIYRQLQVELRTRLDEGAFRKGDALPSEHELARDYGVSRVTVRRTLQLLEEEGLVERKRGVGTFPVDASARARGKAVSGELENLITIGLETQAVTKSCAAVAPNALVQQALGLGEGEEVMRIERVRQHEGAPFSLTKVWLPLRYASLIDETAIDDRPIIQLLEEQGVKAFAADQVISAVAADQTAAEALKIDIGMPLISLRRTVTGKDGAAILFQSSLYAPEHYEYHILLSREQRGQRPHWRHTS